MTKRNKNTCKLCKVKNKTWQDGGFFGINCRNHFVPMIVSIEHKNALTNHEMGEVEELAKKHHPSLKMNFNISDSDDHWHVHLKK